ncbi:lytic murein transglycosylase [Jannaschia seohaensis]|uniref:Transglycosylase SLT domain-containing protein n=1 Tax=Jannaschia seohaensis TaxID=475081 RepID=A0A2Y9AQE2_9RHOB|nr:lytic murein transglycosylase [Jannaschia seohaensis]PWJ18125.1 transglycosylase protein with SLT domain [Jannaschia seohaensis]SSA46650.1 Transglycosylase SLT domain-containing protein [Jannaschia seohaensis]
MRPTLFRSLAFALGLAATPALAAQCGNDASGWERWKQQFAQEAAAAGIGQPGLQALAGASYARRTIAADRNQKGVRYALDDFIRIRLGSIDGFAAQATRRLDQNRAFFNSLEQRYGVPAGILLAIHGMETGFGRNMGSENVVSSILTVAYDCRRSEFFTPHALAALRMVDRGMLSPSQSGAAHGELGHTQFLPGNAMRYGADGNGDGRVDFYNMADAMASTANFLRQKGWQPGQPFQEGTPNFRVLNEWNAATVYQQAIALSAAKIN